MAEAWTSNAWEGQGEGQTGRAGKGAVCRALWRGNPTGIGPLNPQGRDHSPQSLGDSPQALHWFLLLSLEPGEAWRGALCSPALHWLPWFHLVTTAPSLPPSPSSRCQRPICGMPGPSKTWFSTPTDVLSGLRGPPLSPEALRPLPTLVLSDGNCLIATHSSNQGGLLGGRELLELLLSQVFDDGVRGRRQRRRRELGWWPGSC